MAVTGARGEASKRRAIKDQTLPGTAYFQALLATALGSARFTVPTPLVLDLRAGGGDLLFPCLKILTGAHIVATDPDPARLGSIREQVEVVPQWRGRVTWLTGNGEMEPAGRGRFDLVLAASHLNRLSDPPRAFLQIARALRPGGTAILFEPFDNGHAILRLAYQDVLARPEAADLSSQITRFLAGLIENFGRRSGSDRPAEVVEALDAKWLFTRRFISACAEAAGFASVDILPLHAVERLFARQTEAMLGQALGADPEVLPPWAWAVIERYEQAFSADVKYDLLLEGAIILRT